MRCVLLESPPASEPGADATRSKKLLRRSGAFSTQLAVVVGADVVGGRVDDRRLAHDLDRLRELRHVEGGVLLERAADAHPDAAPGDGLEALEGIRELVLARRQVEEAVVAVLVGHRGLRADDVRAAHRDGGARQHGARGVLHGARYGAGRALRVSGRRECEHQACKACSAKGGSHQEFSFRRPASGVSKVLIARVKPGCEISRRARLVSTILCFRRRMCRAADPPCPRRC